MVELLQNDDVKVHIFTLDQLLYFSIVERMLCADQTSTIEQKYIIPVTAVLQIEYIVDWN